MKLNTAFHITILTVLTTLPLSSFSAQIANSFSKAKKKLYKSVYNNQGQTFYVGCEWSKKKVNLESCNLQNSFSTKERKRALRTEAEHVIPSSWFYKQNNQYRQCHIDSKRLKKSTRSYCQKHDDDFRKAHNDLINLRPAVGAINAARSNKAFSETLSGKKETTYNGKGKKIIITSRIVIPDKSIRGDIARIAFYMNKTYGVTYSKRQLETFKKWNSIDPVSDEERKLNQRIQKIQGQGNPYVHYNY
jgi:deoxyribonuclease-1